MKLYLREYNVTQSLDKRDELNIVMDDNIVKYNFQTIDDGNIISEINNMINKYKNDILRIKDIAHSNYKGGRQKILFIKLDDDIDVNIMGNTDNNEVAEFYQIFKEELLNIIKK